jgi:Domain of unknown function (DUF6438)
MSAISWRRGCAAAMTVLAACATPQTRADQVAPDSEAVVRLERGPCHGTCPVYAVALYADGRVQFTGIRFVTPVGTDSSRVAASAVASLRDAFRAREFGAVPSAIEYASGNCGQYIADLSTVVLTVRDAGRTHTVRFDEGCGNHPVMLDSLARQVDSVSGSATWTTPRP